MDCAVDISHPIKNETDLSFRKEDISPNILYLEDSTEGVFHIHAQLNDLLMTYGTHICFAGALPSLKDASELFSVDYIGQYPINNFIGKVAIIDISSLLRKITPYYNGATLAVNLYSESEVEHYLEALSSLCLGRELFDQLCKYELSAFKGILFYTGMSKFWSYEKFDIAEHIYFQSINLTLDLCDHLIKKGITFIGVDSFRIGNPLAIYSGFEKIFSCGNNLPNQFFKQINNVDYHDAHDYLLSNGIYIYRNLNLPQSIAGEVKYFSGVPMNIHIPGMNTSSIVRPYLYE